MNLKLLTMAISTLLITTSAFSQATLTDVEQSPSRYSAYSESIKNCTPGTFKIIDILTLTSYKMSKESGGTPSPISSLPMSTYEIVGWNSGKCQVRMTMVVPANLAQNSQGATIITKCLFPKENLQTLARVMEQAALGNAKISTEDPSNKIWESSCTQVN